MATPVVARLKTALATLWTQLDVEKGCLPSNSCRWLLEELKELRGMSVPAGYALSSGPLTEAAEQLQEIIHSTTDTLRIEEVTALAALLTSTVALLVSPLPPSTVYNPSRPTLPSEIISPILHQVAVAEHTLDVANCCLVSKSFLPLAREALYKTLRLRIEDQERDEDGNLLDLINSAKRGSDLAINYRSLARCLARHPHLGALVRRLVIDFDNGGNDMDYSSALDLVLALLDTCRPLHVELEGANSAEASDVARVLWESRQRFRSLQLGPYQGGIEPQLSVDPALWRLLQEQDTLESLSLELSQTKDIPSRLPSKLKQLNLQGSFQGCAMAPLLDSLTYHSATTLTRLSYPFDLSAKTSTIPQLGRFTNLQSLRLLLSCSRHSTNPLDSPERRRCDALFSTIPPSVLSLSLESFPTYLSPSLVPFDFLPETLVALDIRSLHVERTTLLAFLQSSTSFALKHIRYSSTERIDGAISFWPLASRTEVTNALAQRGITSY